MGPIDEATRRVDQRMTMLFQAMASMQEHISDAILSLEAETAEDEYAVIVRQANATGGNTIAPFDFGAPAQGTAWLVEGITVTAEAIHPPGAWLKLDSPVNLNPGPSDLPGAIWLSNTPSAIMGWYDNTKLYIPSGRTLTGYVVTSTADGLASMALTYRILTTAAEIAANENPDQDQ